MDRDCHFPALADQFRNAALFFLAFIAFPAALCSISIVNKVLHSLILSCFQVAQVFRIDEDFIHPFPADIIRSIFQVCDYFHAFNGFTGRVTVAQYQPGIFEIVHCTGFMQYSGSILLFRHQNHCGFIPVSVHALDQRFPEKTESISQNQMEPSRQIDRNTGISITLLHGEKIQGHKQEHQHNMADRCRQFLDKAPLYYVVHGIEDDRNQNIYYCQHNSQGSVIIL